MSEPFTGAGRDLVYFDEQPPEGLARIMLKYRGANRAGKTWAMHAAMMAEVNAWFRADRKRRKRERRARRRWLALWARVHTSKAGRRGWRTYRTMELLYGPMKYTGEVGRIEGCRFVEYSAPSTYKAPLKFRKHNRGRTL